MVSSVGKGIDRNVQASLLAHNLEFSRVPLLHLRNEIVWSSASTLSNNNTRRKEKKEGTYSRMTANFDGVKTDDLQSIKRSCTTEGNVSLP
jgi:hypothetical protein